MKVVLFCGGLGYRLRNYSTEIPKPLATVGVRPILWHVMKYYAYFGHKDFILCLGYKGDMIKEYFRKGQECLSDDLVLTEEGRKIEPPGKDIDDWRITFVDTGIVSSIGKRLYAVREFLDGEDVFLANYSDNLTDFHLPLLIDTVQKSDAVGGLLGVNATGSFHVIESRGDQRVDEIVTMERSGILINGGYFVFRSQIFDYLDGEEDLVEGCFRQLIRERRLLYLRYDGFWMAMDTFKDRARLEQWYTRDHPPWEVWRRTTDRDQRASHAGTKT